MHQFAIPQTWQRIRSIAIPCASLIAIGIGAGCTATSSSSFQHRGLQSESVKTPATAFTHVNVIPMDQDRVLSDQTVLVQNGVITAIGASSKVTVPAGAIKIESRGKFLMPGLADMHTHLTFTDSAEIERWLFLFAANGVTTIRNLDYLNAVELTSVRPGIVIDFRKRIRAATLVGPRIYTSGPWLSQEQSPFMSYLAKRPKNIDSTLAAYKQAGYDLIKVRDESASLYALLAPAARRAGLELAGHAPHWMAVDSIATSGLRTIEHFTFVSDRPLDSSRIQSLAIRFAKAGVWNCPTQALNEIKADPNSARARFLASPETRVGYVSQRIRRFLWQTNDIGRDMKGLTLEVSRRLIRSIHSAGGGLLLGTDTPVQFQVPGFAVHHELAALVRAGLTPYEALRTGTYNVAEYFKTLDNEGTVGKGKRADLILLDANPLKDIQNSTRIAGVMVNGRWLSKTTIDSTLSTMK